MKNMSNPKDSGRPPPALGNAPFRMEKNQELLEMFLSRWRKIKSSWKRPFQGGEKSRALGNAPFTMEKKQELWEEKNMFNQKT